MRYQYFCLIIYLNILITGSIFAAAEPSKQDIRLSKVAQKISNATLTKESVPVDLIRRLFADITEYDQDQLIKAIDGLYHLLKIQNKEAELTNNILNTIKIFKKRILRKRHYQKAVQESQEKLKRAKEESAKESALFEEMRKRLNEKQSEIIELAHLKYQSIQKEIDKKKLEEDQNLDLAFQKLLAKPDDIPAARNWWDELAKKVYLRIYIYPYQRLDEIPKENLIATFNEELIEHLMHELDRIPEDKLANFTEAIQQLLTNYQYINFDAKSKIADMPIHGFAPYRLAYFNTLLENALALLKNYIAQIKQTEIDLQKKAMAIEGQNIDPRIAQRIWDEFMEYQQGQQAGKKPYHHFPKGMVTTWLDKGQVEWRAKLGQYNRKRLTLNNQPPIRPKKTVQGKPFKADAYGYEWIGNRKIWYALKDLYPKTPFSAKRIGGRYYDVYRIDQTYILDGWTYDTQSNVLTPMQWTATRSPVDNKIYHMGTAEPTIKQAPNYMHEALIRNAIQTVINSAEYKNTKEGAYDLDGVLYFWNKGNEVIKNLIYVIDQAQIPNDENHHNNNNNNR